jgi:hypothetical protein
MMMSNKRKITCLIVLINSIIGLYWGLSSIYLLVVSSNRFISLLRSNHHFGMDSFTDFIKYGAMSVITTVVCSALAALILGHIINTKWKYRITKLTFYILIAIFIAWLVIVLFFSSLDYYGLSARSMITLIAFILNYTLLTICVWMLSTPSKNMAFLR